ncbi:MAG: hypothetical protein KAX20_08015 [Candidatus Omnitrophica bacterium]|nr:hypothetical protein [Candidatus Omnitrophota bacterium]
MAVRYVGGTFEIHGLQLKTQKELSELIAKMEAALRAIHPGLRFNEDVVLDVAEIAGKFEK